MLFLLITRSFLFFFFFFFNDTATTEIYTLSLHDALPIFPLALKRAGLTLSDISLIEMHEAFAAQVLSTFHVLEQNGAGRVDADVVNVMGGSIALGHPFGATGARLVTTLANEMRRRGGQFGLESAGRAGA